MLCNRYIDEDFDTEYFPTIGINFKTKLVDQNEKTIKLQIW